jgi:1-phosphatidylinositol-3-phosphate 5-kinase
VGETGNWTRDGNEVLRPSSPVPRSHHGLLSTDTAACIDERPHIKYD